MESEESTVDKSALEWMRINAPNALCNASDKELVENMGDAFKRHVCTDILHQWQGMG